MTIDRVPDCDIELNSILDYIALDSLQRAIEFNNQLEEHINKIVDMPFGYRQSIYFEDEYIRDLIFKGYTITYYIDK